jgi:hypothetical protein
MASPDPAQPFSIGTPQRGRRERRRSNAVFSGSTSDNTGPNQVDPMSGGFHRWFYGD